MSREFTDQELIRRDKLKKLQDEKSNPFEIEKVKRTCSLNEFKNEFNEFTKEELKEKTNKVFTLAGRLVSLRQTFGVIKDFSTKLQFYVNKKEVDEKTFLIFKSLDFGDIVEITGVPTKTNTGEITIYVKTIKIVTKSLKVLPEKFHGLQDEEIRSRQRYLDLIVNDSTMEIFVLRSKIIKIIRNYLDNKDYFEVETPVLQPTLGGAAAKPFITHHNALDRDYYLRIATEIHLKKIIVGGFEKVYELGRVFRNEGMDTTHNPEFTSLELYEAYSGMEEMMVICEEIFKEISKKLNKTIFKYRSFDVDISKPFKVIHMVDFIKEVKGVDFFKVKSTEEALKIAKEHNISLEKHEQTYGHVVNAFFENFCEEKTIEPTFVWGHPVEVSPLSKKDYSDERFTKRFELFIGQKEFANAFSELNDPIDQLSRFEEQVKEKELGNDEANEIDNDFIEALEYGLPPTGGLGIGIDRLIMLFTEQDSIKNVLLFPHMKEKK